jgi:hypothetical protein
MKLGGVVGTLTLEGDLAPFASLLRAAEVLHAGKGATFGLGKVKVEVDGGNPRGTPQARAGPLRRAQALRDASRRRLLLQP